MEYDRDLLNSKEYFEIQDEEYADYLEENRLTTAEIARIATFRFQFSCAYCDEAFKTNQTILNLPCGHIFHSDCILQSIVDGILVVCPLCRGRLPYTADDN